MKKTYLPPTTTVVRLLHRQPLLITSVGNLMDIEYDGEYDGSEEPR